MTRQMKSPGDILDEVTERVGRAVPGGVGEDVRRNIRGALQASLDRIGLVTREELEVQEAVLRRTRQRLQDLEQQVTALEGRLLKE